MPNLIHLAEPEVQSGRGLEADDFASDHRFGAAVSLFDKGAEFVDREVVLHPVAELVGDVPAVVGERLCRVFGPPAAVPVLQRLREIAVIERGEGLDPLCAQRVGQALVEVDAFRVRRLVTLREDARPGDREAIGVGANVLHQRDVFLVAVIVIVGDVAGVAVLDLPGCVRERVPDRRTLAVLVPRPLDLVRGGSDAPMETLGEPSKAARSCCALGRGRGLFRLALAVLANHDPHLYTISSPMRVEHFLLGRLDSGRAKALLWPKARGDYLVSGRGAGTGEPTSAPGTMSGTRPRLPTGRASRLVSGRNLETQRCGHRH